MATETEQMLENQLLAQLQTLGSAIPTLGINRNFLLFL
jgi:H2-forming N5,N10-methylenetetrahydromethanopterin dehydrogenase-like enzyme